jgi:hypothetical protein
MNECIQQIVSDLLKEQKKDHISIKNIQSLIVLFPGHFKLWKLFLASIDINSSFYGLLLYRKIANFVNPMDSEAWFHRALIFLYSSDLKNTIVLAKKCVCIDPYHVRGQVLIGELAQADEDSVLSQKSFRRVACVAQIVSERFALNEALLREQPINQKTRRLYRLRSSLASMTKSRKISPNREWRGFDSSAKSVLIWGEQGVGDQVFFARDIQRVCRQMSHVGVVVPERLKNLFAASFPNLEILTAPPDRNILDSFEAEILIGNIGDVLPFEKQDGYVNPNQELKAHFRRSYARFGSRIAGLSWKSTSSLKMDQSRTVPEEILRRLILVGQNAGLTWVSIQHGVCDPMQKQMCEKYGLYFDSSVDPLGDLMTHTAQIASMDLVVSVCNSNVHFAGSTGVPTYVMLQPLAKWWWGHSGEDTPWYPRTRLARCGPSMDWETSLGQVTSWINEEFRGDTVNE